VVRVEMGEHEQRHLTHPEPRQTRIDRRRIRAGVDHNRRSRTHRHRDRIALADIACDNHPAWWRPTGRTEHLCAAEHEHEAADH